jgi:hypothetical protein
MMLKASFPAEASNKAIHDGTLPQILEKVLSKLETEAAYFLTFHGKRTMLAFFDMNDSAMIPPIAEPLFSGMQAEIEFMPVMNQAELQQGLAAALAG